MKRRGKSKHNRQLVDEEDDDANDIETGISKELDQGTSAKGNTIDVEMQNQDHTRRGDYDFRNEIKEGEVVLNVQRYEKSRKGKNKEGFIQKNDDDDDDDDGDNQNDTKNDVVVNNDGADGADNDDDDGSIHHTKGNGESKDVQKHHQSKFNNRRDGNDDNEDDDLKTPLTTREKVVSASQSIIFVLFVLCFVGLIIFLVFLAFILSLFQENAIPSMIVMNATIWTAQENVANRFAQAFVVGSNGKFLFVGTNDQLKEQYGTYLVEPHDKQLKIIDGSSLFIVPGFIDSHIHLLTGGKYMMGVRMGDVKSVEQFVETIQQFKNKRKLEKNEWILGGEWNDQQIGALPNKTWIDRVTPENPVWIVRMDGHMGLCNSLCLQMANITSATESPEGGTIDKDNNGEPTGIVKDNAIQLIENVIPNYEEENMEALQIASEYVIQYGVTFVQDMGTWKDFQLYERAHKEKKLKIRLYAAIELSQWDKLKNYIIEHGGSKGDDWFSYGALKGYVDGSLGAQTALQFTPYQNTSENYGLLLNPENSLYRWIYEADLVGLQVCSHAIGDRANRIILDIYEKVFSQNPLRDRRFRVEHAQQILKVDRSRFNQLDVCASMQPVHLLDDILWAEKVLGSERIKDLYVIHSLVNTSACYSFGSDWYVASANPMEGIYAATTRITNNYPQGFQPQERISLERALFAYTYNAAYLAFKENELGRIQSNYLADFVILDQNLFDLSSNLEKLRNTKVLKTVIGGKSAFTHPDFKD